MEVSKHISSAQEATPLADRYPGTLPFGDTPLDHLRFFGREAETRALLYQLLSADLLVLFAKAGLGKTSLLNARLFPLLRESDFLPLPARFNHTDPSLIPMQVFTAAVEQACQADDIDYTPGTTASLWEFFKTAAFWRADRLQTPVLVLDQFEEIFTLQDETFRHAAAAELGQLIGGRLPESVRQQLQAGQPLPFSEKPPEVKVLISLREDYLGLLQELTPEIPTILQHRFRLTGLSETDAWQAVTEPAKLDSEEIGFATHPFEYDKATVQKMTTAARTKEGSIDPFFLQILCSHVEKQIPRKLNPQTPLIQVDPSYLGGEKGIQTITREFYLNAIRRLPRGKLRRRAQRLCEERLLTDDGRRRSVLKEDLEQDFKLHPQALETLEALRLLRREPRHGSFYYEISHDRLAEAVREERRWRLPPKVRIGLTLFVALLLVATGLFSYFQRERILFEERQRAEAERLLDYLIFDLRDKLTPLGRRDLLDEVQKQVDAYYDRMGTAGETDEILRRKSVVLSNKGDLLFNRGDLKAALSAYQKDLAIREKLATRDPANVQWQTDLVVSLVKIATFFEQQRPPRKKDAAANYQRILDILRPLVAENRLTAVQKVWIDIIEKRLEDIKK